MPEIQSPCDTIPVLASSPGPGCIWTALIRQFNEMEGKDHIPKFEMDFNLYGPGHLDSGCLKALKTDTSPEVRHVGVAEVVAF